jgi:hypothetical protein
VPQGTADRWPAVSLPADELHCTRVNGEPSCGSAAQPTSQAHTHSAAPHDSEPCTHTSAPGDSEADAAGDGHCVPDGSAELLPVGVRVRVCVAPGEPDGVGVADGGAGAHSREVALNHGRAGPYTS